MKTKIILGVILVLVLVIGAFIGHRHLTKTSAESSAKEYATNVFKMQDPGIQCVAVDNDDDGYVSCSLFDKERNKTYSIECATLFTLNSGCKIRAGLIQG